MRRTPYVNPDKPLGAIRKHVSFAPFPVRKPVSLDFNGGGTVLSIKSSNSILSEKALQAFKYAFLRNQKIGIGSLPSTESPSQVELDKAAAAYEIARELVEWSEKFCVDEDDDLPDLDNNTEEEHRSCDLKKSESAFPLVGLQTASADAKDLSPSVEGKDLSLDFLQPSSPDIKLSPDLKLSPLLEPFLDDVLIAPASTCEGMDFFGSSNIDDLFSQKWNGKFDRVDVDVSFGASEATVPFLHDSDTYDDLASPLSSPGSPCSPCSPDDILP